MDRTPRVLAFAVVFTLSLAACDSAGLDAGSAADATAAPKGGATPHLTFASPDDFGAAYLRAVKLSADEAATAERADGFVSMRAAEIADAEAIEAGAKSEESFRASVVEDPYLASLLSPTGVVQIGASVYKVGPTTVFSGTASDLEAFNSMTEAELKSRGGYETAAVERPVPTAESVSAAQLRCTSFTGNDGKSYKSCGTTFITNWPWIIHSAGSTTYVLKKAWWFVYLPTHGETLRLNATHRIVAGAGPLPAPTSVSATATNAYVLARIFKYAVGGSDFRGTISATHPTTHKGLTRQSSTSVSIP